MDTAASSWEFVRAGLPDGTAPGTPEVLHFEDMLPGREWRSQPHVIDRAELMQFARTWDPVPFHVDEEAGRAAFGGITAPGVYMLAVKQRLIHTLPRHDLVASLGYDEVRFLLPLRPGDTVTLIERCIDARESKSKADRGVVTLQFSLINQAAEVVLRHLDTILIRKRQAPQA